MFEIIDRDGSLQYAFTVSEAISKGSGKRIRLLADVPLVANTTFPSDISIEPVSGMIISPGGLLLTINSPVVGNPMHQWLSGFSAGDVTFAQYEIEAIWFGQTALALNSAYSAVPDGGTVNISGGTWACGTTVIDTTSIKTVHFKGKGFSKGATSPKITFTTTGTFCLAYYSSLEDVVLSGGNYPLTLGSMTNDPFTGAPNRGWTGYCKNVYLTGATLAGYRCISVQLGHMEKVVSLGNTGAGMFVDDGSNLNTHCVFISCGFNENTLEGIVQTGSPVSNWSNFKFFGCQTEGNNREGMKNTGVLKNWTFDTHWSENNNIGGAASNYDFYLFNEGNSRITIKNSTLITSTSTIKPIGFKGEMIVENNKWSGTEPHIVCLDATGEGKLILKDGFTDLASFISTWTDVRNQMHNASGKHQYIAPPSGDYNINRIFGGVTIINTNQIDNDTYNLPPATFGLRIRFAIRATGATQILTIHPYSGDGIKLTATTAVDTNIQNAGASGNFGDFIELEAVDTTWWVVTAKNGTWT